MSKDKILKRLPKSKKVKIRKKVRKSNYPSNNTNDKYLNFYDDIKISSKKYDW